jgi:hypothetical protein
MGGVVEKTKVRVLPCEHEERVFRMSGSRGLSAVRAINPMARECPVAVVGVYLHVGYVLVYAHGGLECDLARDWPMV